MTPLVTPAQKTPGTIHYVRQQAHTKTASQIARDIGWGVDRVLRLAREHNIELAAGVSNESLSEPTPRREQRQWLRSGLVKEHAGITWNYTTRTVTRGHLAITFGRSMAQPRFFDVLFDVMKRAPDSYLNGKELSIRAAWSCDTDSIFTFMHQINKRLLPLAMVVEGSKGPGGGYRLRVDQMKSEPNGDIR